MPAPEETQQTPTTTQGAGLVAHPDVDQVNVVVGQQDTNFHETTPDYQHQRHYHLPCRIPTFTGRIGQLMKLELSLTQYAGSIIGEAKEFREHQVSGLGGVGKTSLALEYAHRMLHARRYDYVIWLNANNADQLMLEMMDLALTFKLGADIKHLKEKYFTNQSIIKAVYKYLYTQAAYSKVLIIFDNVDQLAVLRGQIIQSQDETVVSLSAGASAHVEMDDDESSSGYTLPSIAAQQERQVVEALNFMPEQLDCSQTDKTLHWLITTRDQSEQQLYPDRHLALHGFSPREAIQYIQSRLGSETSVDQCHRLAHTLHYFPLALAQAVASIEQMQESSIEEYLELYTSTRESQKEFLTRQLPYPDPYREAVYTTWKISAGKLSFLAIQLIARLVYFNSNNILKVLIDEIGLKSMPISLIQVRELLNELRRYSLVQCINNTKQEQFKFHRLLQEIIQLDMSIEDAKECVFLCARIIIDVFDTKAETPNSVSLIFELIPHIDYLWHYHLQKMLVQTTVKSEKENSALFINLLGHAYRLLNEPFKQIYWFNKVKLMFETIFGSSHYLLADVLVNLANAHGDIGEDTIKISLLEEALEIFETNRGEVEVVDCFARVWDNLGNAYGKIGKYPYQISLQEKALQFFLHHTDEFSIEVAGVLSNLARAYGYVGRHDLKSQYAYRALKIYEKNKAMNGASAAIAMHHLGNARGQFGDNKSKEFFLNKAKSIFVSLYGENHFFITEILRDLANMYTFEKDFDKAKSLYNCVLFRQRKFYKGNEQHPEIALTFYNYAVMKVNSGNISEGITMLKASHDILSSYSGYGAGHPLTIQVGKALVTTKRKVR